jgi:hypothetical protein
MSRTNASGMRKSFPSHYYVAKQYNDPVSGRVYGNICLEEIQFSWNEDSLGPPASGQKRKRPGPPSVYHGTRAVWDSMHAARLNLMQGNTHIQDNDSLSLHSSYPSFAGTNESTASLPCPFLTATATASGSPGTDADDGDAADAAFTTVDEDASAAAASAETPSPVDCMARCGTIDCNIGSVAGLTSGVDETWAMGFAEEQFSTLEQVALYHRIMSEQFIVGQRVRVHYGTSSTELWFPAVIHLKNSDGTYQITYLDLDESDPMASKKSPERIKAFHDGHCSYDNEYSGHDEDGSDVHDEVYSDNDYHEDDYLDDDYTDDDDYKIIDRRPRKPGVLFIPSSDQVMEMSRRSSLITKFPPRRGTVYHPVRSRLPVDTTVVVKRSSDGPVLTGVIRQIMQDPHRKERFRYFIRSKPPFTQYYEEIWEDDFLIDCKNGTRWATILPLPSSPEAEVPPRPSSSSTHSDVYLMVTTDQGQKKWPPLTCRMYDFTRGRIERKSIIEGFIGRCSDKTFVACQREYLSCLSTAVDCYISNLPDFTKPSRLGWAAWVPTVPGDLWHLFQLTALLVNTNGTGDDIVKQSIGELFMHQSSALGVVGNFDNPFTFARDPQGAFSFLTARGVGSTVLIGEQGISKGFNYGNEKAKNLIKIAKQLIVFKYCELHDRQLHDVEEEIGSCYHHGSRQPLPASIIDKVPVNVPLFPEFYEETFLNSLHGVGTKIRHLLAEAGYQQLVVRCPTTYHHKNSINSPNCRVFFSPAGTCRRLPPDQIRHVLW